MGGFWSPRPPPRSPPPPWDSSALAGGGMFWQTHHHTVAPPPPPARSRHSSPSASAAIKRRRRKGHGRRSGVARLLPLALQPVIFSLSRQSPTNVTPHWTCRSYMQSPRRSRHTVMIGSVKNGMFIAPSFVRIDGDVKTLLKQLWCFVCPGFPWRW